MLFGHRSQGLRLYIANLCRSFPMQILNIAQICIELAFRAHRRRRTMPRHNYVFIGLRKNFCLDIFHQHSLQKFRDCRTDCSGEQAVARKKNISDFVDHRV